LIFIKTSRYQSRNSQVSSRVYPIGLLGQDVELHFLNYASAEEAQEKWTRRVGRINWDKLFIKFCDRDEFSLELLKEFENLDFKNKVCFISQNYSNFKSAVWIKECVNNATVIDGKNLYSVSKKYFDIPGWLNCGSGKLSTLHMVFNRFIFFLNHPKNLFLFLREKT